MKIVVIGGTGLIGSKLVNKLRQLDHEVIVGSPSLGINSVTGEGLAEAFAGTDIVVDVANSPSFEDAAALEFFQTAGRNLLAAEQVAAVRHHIALSVVGTERLQASGYFRAKMAQEELIMASTVPYTILRSTQFFPFVSGIVKSGAVDDAVHLSPALVQPVSADDVAEVLASIALAAPINGMVEIAGPEAFRLDQFAQKYLAAKQDGRRIETDKLALYFGTELDDRSLTPGPNPLVGKVTFDSWLRESISPD